MRTGNKLMLLCILLLWIPAGLLNGDERETQTPSLKYDIDVKWWILPVYGVLKEGAEEIPLKEKDIKLYINNIEIKEFLILKKIGIKKEKVVIKEKKPVEKLINEVNHITFLLFDNLLTPPLSFMHSKLIARRIIEKSPEGTDFVLLTLEEGSGVKYHFGPSAVKKDVKKILKRKIIPRKKKTPRWGNQRIDYNDISYYRDYLDPPPVTARKNMARMKMNQYLKSLISLKYILKCAMKKSLFFFSSGIKNKMLRKGMPESHYNIAGNLVDPMPFQMLYYAAQAINQSGTMFFIINPEGTRRLEHEGESGEIALKSMALSSGGKYLEGTKEHISEIVKKITGSYYTIAFPHSEKIKGDSIKIKITCKRKDIELYAPKILDSEKIYKNMKENERELLVVDIIENGYWSKTRIDIERVKARRVEKGDKESTYLITLPDINSKKRVDIYLVWKNKKTGDIKLRKDNLYMSDLNYQFKIKRMKGCEAYIVLINSKNNKALYSQL